jgi:hypothetical protein
MCKSFLAELDLFVAFGWIISSPLSILQFIINFVILFYLKCVSAFSPSITFLGIANSVVYVAIASFYALVILC